MRIRRPGVPLTCAWLATVTWTIAIAATTSRHAEAPFIGQLSIIAISAASLAVLPKLANLTSRVSPTFLLLALPSALGAAFALHPKSLTPADLRTQWISLVFAHLFTGVAIASATGIVRPRCWIHDLMVADHQTERSATTARDVIWFQVHVLCFIFFGMPLLGCFLPPLFHLVTFDGYRPFSALLAACCVIPAVVQSDCVRCRTLVSPPVGFRSFVQITLIFILGLGCIAASLLVSRSVYSAWLMKQPW